MPGYWTPESEPVDTVVVSGVEMPGFTIPAGAHMPRKIMKQMGPGFTGYRMLFLGMDIVDFSILCYLQDEQDQYDWEAFKAGPAGSFVLPPKPKKGDMLAQQAAILNPYKVFHPFLAHLNINTVIVEDVMQPVRIDETGGWMHEIKVSRHAPIKRMSATFTNPKGEAPDWRDTRNQGVLRENEQGRAYLDTLRGTPLPAPR